MFEATNDNHYQSGKLLLSHDFIWKTDGAAYSSTDSDSGCKLSEEPMSSAPDTESLLTFSSCNLSASEKMEDCWSEASAILAGYSPWKDQPVTTNTLLSPTKKQNQLWNSNEFKSNFQVLSEVHKRRSFIKSKVDDEQWPISDANRLNFEYFSNLNQTSAEGKDIGLQSRAKYEQEWESNHLLGNDRTKNASGSNLLLVSSSKAENLGNIPFHFLDKSALKSPSSYHSLELNVCVASSGKVHNYK